MLPKVFVIGFNKCGTTSLHKMFKRAGHHSSHHRHQREGGRSVKLVTQIDANARAGLPLLDGIEGAQVYSDMDFCIPRPERSGIGHFRMLDAQYPGSRFILNTRDPLNWLNSRCRHFGGGYLRRAMAEAGIRDRRQICAHWLRDWAEHHAAVTTHFATRPRQLLVFDIERDDPARLRDFLPEFGLKRGYWRHHNPTPPEIAIPELALAG
ncbi:MAG: sulfotransferase [Paracoccus sp. (in: a-proteobacteria)]|nr:sulfotransferase [Paracoccus sp. (in: a-proteobacteria)]